MIKADQKLYQVYLSYGTSRLRDWANVVSVYFHQNQVDKDGKPYIEHVRRVANRISSTNESEYVVALLHDIVEDTPVTLDDLRPYVTGMQLEAIELLTHKYVEGQFYEPYMDYIKKLASNPIARKVKIADLEDNMDLTRCVRMDMDSVIKRICKYMEAYRYLLQFEQQR